MKWDVPSEGSRNLKGPMASRKAFKRKKGLKKKASKHDLDGRFQELSSSKRFFSTCEFLSNSKSSCKTRDTHAREFEQVLWPWLNLAGRGKPLAEVGAQRLRKTENDPHKNGGWALESPKAYQKPWYWKLLNAKVLRAAILLSTMWPQAEWSLLCAYRCQRVHPKILLITPPAGLNKGFENSGPDPLFLKCWTWYRGFLQPCKIQMFSKRLKNNTDLFFEWFRVKMHCAGPCGHEAEQKPKIKTGEDTSCLGATIIMEASFRSVRLARRLFRTILTSSGCLPARPWFFPSQFLWGLPEMR